MIKCLKNLYHQNEIKQIEQNKNSNLDYMVFKNALNDLVFYCERGGIGGSMVKKMITDLAVLLDEGEHTLNKYTVNVTRLECGTKKVKIVVDD